MRIGTATVTAINGLPPAPRKARKDRRKPADETEKQFMGRVVALAKHFGWLVYHTHDSRRSEPGFPDLVLVRGRVLMFAELKVGRNGCSPAQSRWLDALTDAEVICWVWWPEDWDAIVATLSRRG